jgi:hypothetical protein
MVFCSCCDVFRRLKKEKYQDVVVKYCPVSEKYMNVGDKLDHCPGFVPALYIWCNNKFININTCRYFMLIGECSKRKCPKGDYVSDIRFYRKDDFKNFEIEK